MKKYEYFRTEIAYRTYATIVDIDRAALLMEYQNTYLLSCRNKIKKTYQYSLVENQHHLWNYVNSLMIVAQRIQKKKHIITVSTSNIRTGKGLDTPDKLFNIFTKGDNFCDLLIVLLQTKPF